MKPSAIKDVLDLAWLSKDEEDKFIPIFSGDAGIGKSQIIQQWSKDMNEKLQKEGGFKYIDVRIAYFEQPDMIGFPESENDANGKRRTVHNLPEIWPTEGKGIIVFEEPNRGTTGVMNCLMQVLTDRKIHKYELPPGWIMAAAVNPDSAEYDVNAMDAALKNRFVEYEVEYDHETFVSYMERKNWDNNIRMFVKSGAWIFKSAKQIGREGKYISPRTWSQLNVAERNGLSNSRTMHYMTTISVLGKDIGQAYHKFCYDEAPVLAKDLVTKKRDSLEKLKKQSKADAYRGDMIAITVESICKNYSGEEKDDVKAEKVGEQTMSEVAKIIPSDQAINLIKECIWQGTKGSVVDCMKDFVKRHPELVDVIKSNIQVNARK